MVDAHWESADGQDCYAGPQDVPVHADSASEAMTVVGAAVPAALHAGGHDTGASRLAVFEVTGPV